MPRAYMPLKSVAHPPVINFSNGVRIVTRTDFEPPRLLGWEVVPRFPPRSLGTFIPRQLAFWYRGDGGVMSAAGRLAGTDEWRKVYWENFRTTVTTRLKDRQHEREYRITLQSNIVDLVDSF